MKTLVCVIAQTRAHELSWARFKENVIDSLGADLAVCIGTASNGDNDDNFVKHAKFKLFYQEPSNYRQAFDHISRFNVKQTSFSWDDYLRIGHNFLGGVDNRQGSGGILLFFKSLLFKFLKGEGILDSYDRFIVTRSDFLWLSPHPPIELLDPNFVWIPDGQHWHGIVDRHTVLSHSNIEEYLTILDKLIVGDEILRANLLKEKNLNLESLIYKYYEAKNKLSIFRKFPYVMFTIKGAGDGTTSTQGIFHSKYGGLIKSASEYTEASYQSRFYRTKEDWRDSFKRRVITIEDLTMPVSEYYEIFSTDGRLLLWDASYINSKHSRNETAVEGTSLVGLVLRDRHSKFSEGVRPVYCLFHRQKIALWVESKHTEDFIPVNEQLFALNLTSQQNLDTGESYILHNLNTFLSRDIEEGDSLRLSTVPSEKMGFLYRKLFN